nr:nucleocapsid protein [Ailanthus crinkle leaf associated emaravirus]
MSDRTIFQGKTEITLNSVESIKKDGKTIKYARDYTNNRKVVAQPVVLEKLESIRTSTDSFNLENYKGVFVDVALSMITNSEMMNRAKKNKVVQKIEKFSAESYISTLFIVPELQSSDKVNILSYNRAMAVCIYTLRMIQTKRYFDWNNYVYVDTKINLDLDVDTTKHGNKLALSVGLNHDHPFHWFYASGYEYTFEFFPAEVIAMTLFRVKHKHELKLEKMEIDELIRSTASQIAKKGKIVDIIRKIGVQTIRNYYDEIINNRMENLSSVRISEFKSAVEDLFKF